MVEAAVAAAEPAAAMGQREERASVFSPTGRWPLQYSRTCRTIPSIEDSEVPVETEVPADLAGLGVLEPRVAHRAKVKVTSPLTSVARVVATVVRVVQAEPEAEVPADVEGLAMDSSRGHRARPHQPKRCRTTPSLTLGAPALGGTVDSVLVPRALVVQVAPSELRISKHPIPTRPVEMFSACIALVSR